MRYMCNMCLMPSFKANCIISLCPIADVTVLQRKLFARETQGLNLQIFNIYLK